MQAEDNRNKEEGGPLDQVEEQTEELVESSHELGLDEDQDEEEEEDDNSDDENEDDEDEEAEDE